MKNKVFVKNDSCLIGCLWEGSGHNMLCFQYDSDWLARTDAYPISLSLGLKASPHSSPAVFHFFDNLLPDSLDTRKKIQYQCRTQSSSVIDLLRGIGQDCIGSLYFSSHPEISRDTSATLLQYLSNEEIFKILRSLKTAPLGLTASKDFRISLAGMQEKTALFWDPQSQKWAIPLKNTPSTHIFKPPIGQLSDLSIDLHTSCENEWLCSKIIRAFGLKTANTEILSFDGQKVLVVERFDRIHQSPLQIHRVPQEDLCQALGIPSALKYQFDGGPGIPEIMHLLLGSLDASAQREHFFKTQILFWLMAAIDGHAKNFSIFLGPQNDFMLTPLYDIISAYPLMHSRSLQQQKVKMAMALKGESFQYQWNNLTSRYIMSTAMFVKFSTARAMEILESVCIETPHVVSEISRSLPPDFPASVSDPIFNGVLQTAKMLLMTLPKKGNLL